MQPSDPAPGPAPDSDSAAGAAVAKVIDAVRACIADAGGRIVVAYSGGIDSTVLLWSASRLAASKVLAAHVNHRAQPAADEWQRHAARFAASLGVGFATTSLILPADGNFEARAREARHGWLAGLLRPDDLLLLAHHLDDQAETVLLRLLQGRGAYGVPERRHAGAGQLRRPLLEIPAELIRSVALSRKLPFVTDPTNLDGGNDRSWLRTAVMPLLAARFPEGQKHSGSVRSLTRAAGIAGALETAGQHLAALLPEPMPLASLPADAGSRVEVLRWWLQRRGAATPSRKVLNSWLDTIETSTGEVSWLNLGSGRLVCAEGLLYLSRDPQVSGFPVDSESGERACGVGVLRWRGIDPSEGLHIEFDQPGAQLLRAGRRVDVRTLLQSAVLPWERSRFPLLFRGAELVEVPGLATADGFASGRVSWTTAVPVFRPGRRPAS